MAIKEWPSRSKVIEVIEQQLSSGPSRIRLLGIRHQVAKPSKKQLLKKEIIERDQ